LQRIAKRNEITFALEASLHGFKLPALDEIQAGATDFNEDDDALAEKAMTEAMERKIAERVAGNVGQ
jgi:hypothetical protein